MKKTGVFYGSSTGTCEELANQIAEKLGVSSTDVHSVDKMTADKIKEYEVLVLGDLHLGRRRTAGRLV